MVSDGPGEIIYSKISAIGFAVAIDIAGRETASEDIVDNPNSVADVNQSVTVGFSGFKRVGRRAAHEDVVDDINGVTDINSAIVVGVAANIRMLGSPYHSKEVAV